jgi:hypothetical protein
MIASLEIDREELRSILDGLGKTISIQDDAFEDFNLVALKDANQLKIFVRHFDFLQVVHTLHDSENISIDVKKDTEMVFNSDVITSLIQQSKSEKLNFRFYDDKFAIETRDSWFSTPTTFTLNLFQESQFQPITNPSGFDLINSFDRSELIENLDMMGTVSKVVKLKLTGSEFWISVSDAVHGQGKVMKSVDRNGIKLQDFEHKYRIDTIQTYLKSIDTDMVDISVNQEGVLKIEAEKSGHTSEFLIACRMDEVA